MDSISGGTDAVFHGFGPDDERMMEHWFRSYHPRLRSFCARLVGDSATAEDIAQETLVRAWSHRERFAPGDDIAPWLFRVARNQCSDALRARAHLAGDRALPEHPDLDADPSAPLERAVTGDLVRQAFAMLSERQRQVLLLRDVHGLDYPEVADRLGVSEGCARVVLLRARRGLRKTFLEVAAATAALVFIPLGKLRDAVRARLDPALTQPVGLLLGQASLGFVAAASLFLANGAPATVPVGLETHVDVISTDAGHDVAVDASIDGVDNAPIRTRFTDREQLPVAAHISANDRGEVHATGSAPNPVTGADAEAWANIQREAGEQNSTVLSHVDETSKTTCDVASPACGEVEGITR